LHSLRSSFLLQWSAMVPVKEQAHGCVKIAAHPCSYMFLSTDKLPQASVGDSTPVFVDLDSGIHICPTEFRTICGGFSRQDHRPLSLPSHNNDWQIPPADWDQFYPTLQRLMHRCPSLGTLPHGDLISGAEMFTPDSYPVIGEYQVSLLMLLLL
jgi:glycine/D-amino acid oxidase-like deaminating enzyme